MADLTYRSDVSSKIRNRLRLLRHDLFRPKFVLEESSVTPDYQKIHGIEQHPNLIWEEGGEPESSLSFATPLDNTVVDKAFEDAYEEEEKSDWPVHDLIDGRFFPAHQLSTALLNYMFHISYYVPTVPWKGMRENGNIPFYSFFYQNFVEEWRTMRFFESVDKHKPHLAAVIADGAPAGPELRRSELFCAVTLIMRSMTVDKHHEHMINPVFVYSVSDRSLRIIQVYFDYSRDKLVYRMTPYIELATEEERDDSIKQCVRWMLSTPKGETRFKATSDTGNTLSKRDQTLGLRLLPATKTVLSRTIRQQTYPNISKKSFQVFVKKMKGGLSLHHDRDGSSFCFDRESGS